MSVVSAWRIAVETRDFAADDLSGGGAKLSGGRWNRIGSAMVYASSSIALACLETVVHLSAVGLPLNRYVVRIDIPRDLWNAAMVADPAQLVGWDAEPYGVTSQRYGDSWLQAGESALGRGDDGNAARRFAEIQETARDNLAEARALVAAMAPPSLERDGLVGALRRLSERHATETGVPVRFSVLGRPRSLAPSSEVTALRAAQESLANARRHADATEIEVVLTFDEDGATVTVVDDGVGFDPGAPRNGFGLDGLASRVQVVGGLVDVTSEAGSGTRVRVRVP